MNMVRLVGADPRGLHPGGGRGHRDAHPARRGGGDQVGRARSRRWRPSASTVAIARRLRLRPRRACCSSRSTRSGSRSSTAATTSASTASRCRCSRCRRSSPCLCVIYSWNHFPEPHNPKAFLALDADPRGRHERHVRRPGPHPVLRLLRDRAAPDVLHDRRVGRPEPRVRVDQVLPVHAVRLGADAAELPGALLQGRRLPERPGRAAQLRHGAALARGRRRPRAQHAAADLRRACSSASRSRCRCSRSTPGCPTRTPRRRRSARCCWPRSC